MIKLKILFSTLVVLIMSTSFVSAQKELDSVFLTLDNKDFGCDPIFILFASGEIEGLLIAGKEPKKIDSAERRKREEDEESYIRRKFDVESFDWFDKMRPLVEKYGRDVVARKLYALLKDPKRDMYADALLFDVIGPDSGIMLLNFCPFNGKYLTRKQWISSGLRDIDLKYWRYYFEQLEDWKKLFNDHLW